MYFSVASWNINSVRLRLSLVLRYLQEKIPDVLCLQETKCPNEYFPILPFTKIGYPYIEVRGEKGYNGVAIISRYPLSEIEHFSFCNKGDCRHLAASLSVNGRKLRLHNFYVPAGGDIADVKLNPKFQHKIDFLECLKKICAESGEKQSSLLVGDLNIAPYVHDVWSHKQLLSVVSHTPIETTNLLQAMVLGGWVDLVREFIPEPKKVYTWWSYRAKDWMSSDKGRRLDHIWGSADLQNFLVEVEILKAARQWLQPSDHVPLSVKFKF